MAVEDLRARLLVMHEAWDDRKRWQKSTFIAQGRIILSPWLSRRHANQSAELIFQVDPLPLTLGPQFEETLRAIFPSLTNKGRPNADSFIITSDKDRVLFALLESV